MKIKLFCLIILLATGIRSNAQVTLSVQFVTGGDDLRGGNDNVNLLVLLKSGSPVRFDNVNGGKQWNGGASNTVTRTLPAAIRTEDIAGIRLETTFSGGISGDNWNLDQLVVNARTGSANRQLFNRNGRPLFRFTGDQRVREFLFSATPAAPAPAVMTRFNPAVHGFKFVNNFKNIFISAVNWTTSGLCGGMAYAALDFYKAGVQIPQQDFMPAEGTPLQSYLYNRQVNSIVNNADKWAEHGFNPGGARNREFFNWGLQAGSGRLGELQSRLDRGEPVPLGLQECGADCSCAGGCPGSHQVLAIGYQLGRYKGDLGDNIEDLSIFIYDPNHPGVIRTLKPNVQGAWYEVAEERRERWRAYFVDAKYAYSKPPSLAAAPANELQIKFVTGGDDLRGGNDNVSAVLLLRSGATIRFDNVNEGKRWIDGSSQTISRALPGTVQMNQIAGIRLETTFGGGIAGDNWNLDGLTVKCRINGTSRDLFNQMGTPLFRFTGSNKSREFRF